LALAALSHLGAPAQTTAKGHQRLADLLKMLPPSPAWEQWLRASGELPPDFDSLPSLPGLPDPLRFANGRPVKSKAQWAERRQELLRLFGHYVIGTLPPPPGNVRAAELKERAEANAIVREVTLEFGPAHEARLHLELIFPKGKGPFPVFLTQDNHRRWALVAVSRGYLGCVYAGADSRDDTGAWPALWPAFDWTKLARRAWAASRCIDYLCTLPEVDRSRIALTGHSRNGKLSLIAAALDERIAAVISSSSGAGGACTYRFFSETQFGEGIELITRAFPDWLHPRLRFFTGRENKLPIDQHELVACIAPRPCLISTALNDNVESVWAIEQTWRSARRVYALLGAPEALALRYRPGLHATGAQDIEGYVDWLDSQFGRRTLFTPSRPIYPTYEQWQQASGERINPRQFPERGVNDLLRAEDGGAITNPAEWAAKRVEIRRRLEWALGEAPPAGASTSGEYGSESKQVAALLGRAAVPANLVKASLNFGNYIAGDLYYPANVDQTKRRLPALIWLHPISNSNGYVPGYYRGEPPHLLLARSGYAVFAYDQIGNGARLEEIRGFYQRYPRWSLLGKMVRDALAAVDALAQHPHVDPSQIFLVGYSTGAMTALHAAALDERIAGVIAVAGFTPLRPDTAEKGTGGIARWSHWLPLQPRLGAFVGQEARIPYDYHEVLALIAPRPALVITPRLDYQSSFDDLKLCLDQARQVYALLGNPAGLVFQRTDDYNHFSPDLIFCLCGAETIR
jgi:cephalosporin-C deacetylase-like acetyl esterase